VRGAKGQQGTFTGIFLQPFLGTANANAVLGPFFPPTTTLSDYLCGGAPPNPNFGAGGPDYKWVKVENGVRIAGHCVDLEPRHLSLGYPTLRFDLFFP
jgi:hypothetical protein